jgi:hypothetical protein
MPVYNVIGPDGKKFRVNSKEGQTQEDANRYIFGKYYADTPVDAAKVSSLATVIPTPAPQPKPKERSYIPAPSIAEKALQPITSYPEALQRAAGESYEFAREGVAKLQEPGVMPKLKGVGKIGLGMLGVATAPVEAAIETVAGKPIEEATGIPSEGTELILGMALPFGGKTKAVKKAAKTIEEKTGVDVLEATAAGQAEKAAREQVIKSTQAAPTVEQLKPGIAAKPIQIYQDYVGRPALEFMKKSPLATTTGAVTGVFGMENLPEDATVQDKAQAFALGALAGFGGAKGLKYVAGKVPAGNDENLADKFARGFIDNYGLPQDYLDVKQNAKMFKNQMSSDFLDLTRDVAKLSDDERKAMYYIMQGEQLPIESVAALSDKARDTITKYGQKMVDVGLLSPKTFQKNAATYLRREYASKLKPEGYLTRAANNLRLIGSSLKPRGVIIEISPKNLEKYKAEGWEKFGEAKSGNKIRVRRQLTAEERKAKGEIDDAAYAISRTGQLMSNDIATYKMYDDISKMDQYVSDQPVEGWIQLSSDKIPKTNIARYGNLAGKYVSPEVARDLQGLELTRGLNRNPIVSAYRQALAAWKAGKTALNPAVHMNNVVSNVMLYDLSGSDWRSLASAANELRKGDKSDLYKQAEKLGVFDAGFSSQELGREGKNVLDAIEASRPADNAVDAALKIASAGWKKTGGKIIDAYQGEDSIFRFGIFLDRIRAGMSPEDAAKESKKWLIDYEINAPAIQAMRNTTHPFIAYSYRAIPLLAESAALRPWKYAKWAALGYGLNEYGEQESPGRDVEKERRMLPEYQKGTMFGVPGAPPTMIKLPSEEPVPDAETGEVPPSMYLDVQRFIPGGDVFATTEAAGRRIEYLPQFLQPGGPLFDAFSVLYEGRDPFTGKDLPGMNIGATEGEVRANNAAIKASKFITTLLPNLPGIPGAPATEKFKKAEAGAESLTQPQISTTQAVLQTFGIKVTPVDVEKLSIQQLLSMKKDVDNVAKDYTSVIRRHEQGLANDEELSEASAAFDSRLKNIFDKYQKREEGPAKEEPEAAAPAPAEAAAPEPEAPAQDNRVMFTGPDGKVYRVKVKPGQTEADVQKYIMQKYYPQNKAQGGLVTPGNIDVSKLPAVRNPDGTYSTVRSMGVNIDGKEVLIPTVINGRVVSEKEAIDAYLKTGKHLGIFSSPEASTAYAQRLHEQEAQRIKKAKGGVVYTPAEEVLLRRYASR